MTASRPAGSTVRFGSASIENLAAPLPVAGQPVAGREVAPLVLEAALCCVCGDEASEPAAMTEDFDLRTSPDTFLALECAGCGCIYFSMVATGGSASRIYPPGYLERWQEPTARRQRRGANVLDLPAPLDGTRFEELAREAEGYDEVRLELTLEHAPDPTDLLRVAGSALRPGGTVVLILNNLRSPAARLFKGRHWAGYDPPRQRRVFSQSGLSRLASAAGLQPVGFTTAASAEPWVRSMRRLCEDWEAPSWLTARFSPQARVSRVLFGLLEGWLRLMGRGALLVATLRPSESASTS
jgi:Methyltransferase domain